MNLLIAPSNTSRITVACPGCGDAIRITMVESIQNTGEYHRFFHEHQNLGFCGKCDMWFELRRMVVVEIDELPLDQGIHRPSPHLLVPAPMLDDPAALEYLLWLPSAVRVVHSREELEHSFTAGLALALHRRERMVHIHGIEVPEAFIRHATGKLRKNHMRILWFISTFFTSGREYTLEEAHRIIEVALSRVTRTCGLWGFSQVTDLLRKAGLMTSNPDRNRFMKTDTCWG